MSTDPIVLGQIVAQQPESVSSPEQVAQTTSGGLGETYVQGQVLQARVAAVLSGQQILLELGGVRLEASGLTGLVEGQTLTVRVAGVQPSLLLEVLAERTPAEQHLATALKNLFSGNQGGPKLWTNLQSLLQQLQSLPQSVRQGIPDALINSVLQKLQPLTVGQGSATSAADVRAAIANLGLDVETALRSATGGQAAVQGAQDALKPALGRLLASLQQVLSGGNAAQATPVQEPLPQATVERMLAALDRFIDRVERGAGETGQRTADLPVLRSMRLQTTPDIARKALLALQSARSSVAGLAKGGEEQQTRLRTALEALRVTIPVEGGDAARVAASNVQGEMARLATDLEAILNRSTEGRELIQRMALAEATRAAGNAHERIEAFQVLNSHLGERSQQLHLFMPVAFADEITEMQLKQFTGKGEGGKGKGDTLTVVMLLQLESIGALRIDALAQEKALYVNIFVERPEVKPVVEEMAVDFGKQLQARGFSLARLVCQADEKKIQQFHTLDDDLLADDEGLVDMKI